METGDPIVTAGWLKQNLSAPDIRVVDATYYAPFLKVEKTGRDDWAEAHIPGAVHFDIDAIKAGGTDLPHMLPDPIMFSSRVRKLGIGDGNRVIVYDNNNFCAAARVWWMLRVMGHNDVTVLDGGLAAWKAEGGELEDMPPVSVERHFTARVRSDLVKDINQVAAASAAGSHTIVDARAKGRFTAEAPEPREGLPPGHIPGSASVPDWQSGNPDGTLKAPPHDATGHTWHHADELLFRVTKFGTAKALDLKDFKSNMPAFEDTLSDAEIVAALSWIKAQWPEENRERHDMMNERVRSNSQ